MPLTETQSSALGVAAKAALQSEQEQDVPMELTIPQWALESGWGVHQPGNNPFGIKSVPGEAYTEKLTSEYISGKLVYETQDFESFDNLPDAFSRHAQLITSGTYFKDAYSEYEDDRDVPALIRNVAVHYSTSPVYADTVLTIGRMPEVQKAIALARSGAAGA